MDKNVKELVELVEKVLLPQLTVRSESEYDPVAVKDIPENWKLIGKGNYAAVLMHTSYEDFVVKVYGRAVDGVNKEAKVYERLGLHPAYSQLFYKGNKYLILKKLTGVTLYDAVHHGIYIPESVIKDINAALDYARKQGLNPFDVHGKNVMMKGSHGYVVDVSDFYKKGVDKKWTDLVKAYYKIYVPVIGKYNIRIPYFLLNIIRHSYRLYRKVKRKFS
ncbi:serine/threonine protein kinase [Priestia megaterium]|nr:serine/threonine protein kinase [Priestia megaterium]